MRKIIAGLALIATLGGYVLAQDATLSAPVVRTSEAKYVLASFSVSTSSAEINVSVQDASNGVIRVQTYSVPDAAHPSATLDGFLTAIGTARSGETGVPKRRASFRVLGFLSDNGYYLATLNP